MKRIHVLTAAALSWPLCALFWLIPNKYDIPYFFTLLCLAIIYFMPEEKEVMTEEEFIKEMKKAAFIHCKVNGHVSSDNIREIAELYNWTAPTPQSWAKILTLPNFVKFDTVKSTWPSNQGRKIGVYRLAGEV